LFLRKVSFPDTALDEYITNRARVKAESERKANCNKL
jgi:hypothetical protein